MYGHWAESSNSVLRTTKILENLILCSITSNPNIFQFIEMIKNLHCEVYIEIRSTRQKTTREKHLFLSQKLNAFYEKCYDLNL